MESLAKLFGSLTGSISNIVYMALGAIIIGLAVLLWYKSSELKSVEKTNTTLVSDVASKATEILQLKQSLKDCSDNTQKLKDNEDFLKAQSKAEIDKIQAELDYTKSDLVNILTLQPRGATDCEQTNNLVEDLVSQRIKK